MMIELLDTPFDPWACLAAYQTAQQDLRGRYGATAVFVGSLRDFNDGAAVHSLFLEHYPGMTEKQLQRLLAEASERWPLLDALLLHRVGAIEFAEPIVLVAVWSTHRGDAFDACRYLLEALKSRAPFWKKETLAEGARWVEHNSDGYAGHAVSST